MLEDGNTLSWRLSSAYSCLVVISPLFPLSKAPPSLLRHWRAYSRPIFDPVMRAERQRLHIDPYYCPPLTDGYDPNSPQSSPSPSFFFSPPTDMLSTVSRSSASTAPEWRLCFVLCLYDFAPTDPDHLPFRKNEILEIVEKEESGWWAALRDNRIGWVPSAFVAELSNDAADWLLNVREELRVCEYEAEKLFAAEPVHGVSRFVDSTMSPISARGHGYNALDDDNWVPILEPGRKAPFLQTVSPSVHVVTDFPDDVGPLSSISPHSHVQIDAYSIEAELGSTPNKGSLASSVVYPRSPNTPMPQLVRPDLTALQINKPTPPTPPAPSYNSPSFASPRSPLNRSRSDSSPSMQTRHARRRPIMVNDFKSLSRLSVFLDSPHLDAVATAADELQSAFEDVRPPSTPRRSDKVKQLTGDDEAQAFHNSKVAQASLPWYLRPSYSPDDIKLEYDGSVRAGTLPALVERLTADPLKMAEEKLYRDVCLTTFSTFTTATDLFLLLVDRYEMEYPSSLTQAEAVEWREKRLRPVQKRVLAILTMWVEDHGMLQDDPHVVLRLKEFLSMIISPPTLALSAKLLLQSIDKLLNITAQTNLPPPAPLTPVKRRKHNRIPKNNELTRFEPADIAAQLMLYEHRLYVKIRPRECLLWAKNQMGDGVVNLSAFCATHDRIAAWVQSSVLGHEGLGKRADAVEYWIKVAEKCRAINNFSSMSAIIAALSSAVLARLHLTWAHVGRTHQFEALQRLNEPTGNFSTYRAMLQSNDGPCVPFIGIFLTDIVHIQDHMRDNVQFPLSTAKAHRIVRAVSPSPSEPQPDRSHHHHHHHHHHHDHHHRPFATAAPPLASPVPSFLTGLPSPCSVVSCPAAPGTTTTTSVPLGPPLISFVKRQKFYDAIRAVIRFQGKAPNVVEDPVVMTFINEQLTIGAAKLKEPSAFWTRSQELQASEISHADIRKGLEAAGF